MGSAPRPGPTREPELKSWLFRIATNVCFDQIEGRRRRARPVDLASAGDAEAPARPGDEDEHRLLVQYLETFAEYDIDRIVALLRYDVVFDMPPLALWPRGPDQVGKLMLGQGAACRGSKLVAVRANGCPAFASYKPYPETRDWLPWSLTVLELAGDGEGRPAVSRRRTTSRGPSCPRCFVPSGCQTASSRVTWSCGPRRRAVSPRRCLAT